MYSQTIDIQPPADEARKGPVRNHSLQERERLQTENAILVERLGRRNARVQELSRENRLLRDALAQARRENAHLKVTAQARPAQLDRAALVRLMLRDRACRNP